MTRRHAFPILFSAIAGLSLLVGPGRGYSYAQPASSAPCGDVADFDLAVKTAFEKAVADTQRGTDPPGRYATRVIEAYRKNLLTMDDRRWYGALLRCFVTDHLPESSRAQSASSNANNPAAAGLVERSGFTDTISLALDGQNLIAADENAVTVNLSALALKGRKETFANPIEFQNASTLRRIGGSFTFGSKLPKKELVGFSGFPAADELFDAVSWDVKIRVIGDRDPRAERWESVLARVSLVTHQAAHAQNVLAGLVGSLPAESIAALRQVITQEFQAPVAEHAARELTNSWQVTLRAAGQHLTQGEDADKYSFGLLADRGFGDWDLTLNALYSRSRSNGDAGEGAEPTPSAPGSSGGAAAVSASASTRIENLEVTLGLTRTLLQGVFREGRGTELTLAGRVLVPLSESGLLAIAGDAMMAAANRGTVWKVNGALSFPIGDSGKIPVSVTYTNDPNELSKNNYVEGRIGISWDFGSLLKQLKKES